MQPVHEERFYHEGRGPELRRAHWSAHGTSLRAIDYFNPDVPHTPDHLSHVRFIRPQVVAITPEEVIDYRALGDGLVRYRPAALFDLGRSAWLESFNPHHLVRCRHYQLFFYDQLFDVICEGLECHAGGYTEAAQAG